MAGDKFVGRSAARQFVQRLVGIVTCLRRSTRNHSRVILSEAKRNRRIFYVSKMNDAQDPSARA